MAYTKSDYDLNEDFVFTPPLGARLKVKVLTASVSEEYDEITECILEIEAEPDVYARIEREALFNLSPEVIHPNSIRFDPLKPVVLEIGLHAQWLNSLVDQTPSLDDAIGRLFEWSYSDDPLLQNKPELSTQNWYALRVKQAVDLPKELQAEGSKLFEGYSTTWSEPN